MFIALTPDERSIAERQLKEARDAYHTLSLGQQARVIVDQNGERVEFASANKGALYAYIASLESKLGICTRNMALAGPARFIF